MSDSKLVRPPQVTMAAWVTIVGSLFLVVSVFEVVANLRSMETRDRVTGTLGEPPLDGLGLGVEQALTALHVVSLVAAGCATAAAILGWQVLRRNRLARVVLSVLVLPLFLAGIVTGGFLSSMVAVAVILLWTRPARDWFDGIAPKPATPTGPTGPTGLTGLTGAPRRDPAAGPPPFSGFGALPAQEPATPEAAPTATSEGSAAPDAPPRPRGVVQACVLTWAFSGVILLGMLVAVVVLLADPSVVQDVYDSDDRLADSGVGVEVLRRFTIVLAGVLAIWAAAAAGLAVLVMLRHDWARITLLVSACVAALLSLLMSLAAPGLLLVTLACVLTAVLLLRPASTAWFTRTDRRTS